MAPVIPSSSSLSLSTSSSLPLCGSFTCPISTINININESISKSKIPFRSDVICENFLREFDSTTNNNFTDWDDFDPFLCNKTCQEISQIFSCNGIDNTTNCTSSSSTTTPNIFEPCDSNSDSNSNDSTFDSQSNQHSQQLETLKAWAVNRVGSIETYLMTYYADCCIDYEVQCGVCGESNSSNDDEYKEYKIVNETLLSSSSFNGGTEFGIYTLEATCNQWNVWIDLEYRDHVAYRNHWNYTSSDIQTCDEFDRIGKDGSKKCTCLPDFPTTTPSFRPTNQPSTSIYPSNTPTIQELPSTSPTSPTIEPTEQPPVPLLLQPTPYTFTRPSSSSSSSSSTCSQSWENKIDDCNIHERVEEWINAKKKKDKKEIEEKYGHISDWDTSTVTDFSRLFKDRGKFNDDISKWDTSNAITMEEMFYEAWEFNSGSKHGRNDIALQWNTSSVINFQRMFYGTNSFNSDITMWDVRSGQNFIEMFKYAASFNQKLCWNINTSYITSQSNYQYIDSMFCGTNVALLDPTCVDSNDVDVSVDYNNNDDPNSNVSTTTTTIEMISDYTFDQCHPDLNKEFFIGSGNSNSNSSCFEDGDELKVDRTRAKFGCIAGFGYFFIIWAISSLRGLCCNIPNALLIALSALSTGLGAAYAIQQQTPEEYTKSLCEDFSYQGESSISITSMTGLVVVLVGFIEFIFDCMFCFDMKDVHNGYAHTRLLSAHSREIQTCQWWTVISIALGIALFGTIALPYDGADQDFPTHAIVLLSIYESIMFLIICFAIVTPSGCFKSWSAASVWAFVVWFIIDIPGIVLVLTGLDGSIVPLIAQLLVEAILVVAERATNDDD